MESPYSPKSTTSHRENIYPKNYFPSLKDHALKSLAMSSGLISGSYIIRFFDKKMWNPNFKVKDIIPLFLLIMPLTYILDYLQRYEYIPYIFDFRLRKDK